MIFLSFYILLLSIVAIVSAEGVFGDLLRQCRATPPRAARDGVKAAQMHTVRDAFDKYRAHGRTSGIGLSELNVDPTTVVYDGITRASASMTTVTAYWRVAKSKHSDAEYDAWMSNFMRSVGPNLVVYTHPDLSNYIMSLRPEALRNSTLIIDAYDGPGALPCIQQYATEYSQSQELLDPERRIHSWPLYAVWNGKICMLHPVMEVNPFGTELFQWVDVGSFRSRTFSTWPDAMRLQEAFGRTISGDPSTPQVLFELMTVPTATEFEAASRLSIIRSDIVAGTFLIASKEGVAWFYDTFWCLHDFFLNQGLFVGKDQNIYAVMALAATSQHARIWVLPTEERHVVIADANIGQLVSSGGVENAAVALNCEVAPRSEYCGDTWFYYHSFLATPSDLPCYCKINTIRPMDDFYTVTLS